MYAMLEGAGADAAATAIIILFGCIGLLFALVNALAVKRVRMDGGDMSPETYSLVVDEVFDQGEDGEMSGGAGAGGRSDESAQRIFQQVEEISKAISDGANSFLFAEYKYMMYFIVMFSVVVVVVVGLAAGWLNGLFTMFAFILGSLTSIVAGFVGMRIAVYSNSRTAVSAMHGVGPAFQVAFKGGLVMGFALVCLGLLNLLFALAIFKLHYGDDVAGMMEAISGFGLGGSSIALFGRVGGGIYTKGTPLSAHSPHRIRGPARSTRQ